MLLSALEFIRLIIVTFAIGYIFSDYVSTHPQIHKRFDWSKIKTAITIAAPAVILHELSHKFAAMFFGLKPEFFASYFGLALGIILKSVNAPFLVFMPGYVSISQSTAIQSAIIAFIGPLANLLLWLIPSMILKYKTLGEKTSIILYATKKINMMLFIFNMIPIPPFDGSKVLFGLLSYFGI